MIVAQQGQAIGCHIARDVRGFGVDLDVACAGVGGDGARPTDAFADPESRIDWISHGKNGIDLTAGLTIDLTIDLIADLTIDLI